MESLCLNFPSVVKKDGRREPFDKEKILRGLQASCSKRPISSSQLDAVVDCISAWFVNRGEKEVPARMIGQKVMKELRLLDDVAYVRFASVYRTFKDVQEFVETLEDLNPVELYDQPAQLILKPNYGGDSDAKTVERTRPADTVSN